MRHTESLSLHVQGPLAGTLPGPAANETPARTCPADATRDGASRRQVTPINFNEDVTQPLEAETGRKEHLELRFLSDFTEDNAEPREPIPDRAGGLPPPRTPETGAPPPPRPVLPARLGTRGRDSWGDTLSRQCQPCQLLFPHGREHWERETVLITMKGQGQQEALLRLPSCQLMCPSSCSPWHPGGGLLTDPRPHNTQPTSQAAAGTAGVSWGLRRQAPRGGCQHYLGVPSGPAAPGPRPHGRRESPRSPGGAEPPVQLTPKTSLSPGHGAGPPADLQDVPRH